MQAADEGLVVGVEMLLYSKTIMTSKSLKCQRMYDMLVIVFLENVFPLMTASVFVSVNESIISHLVIVLNLQGSQSFTQMVPKVITSHCAEIKL